MKNKLIYYSFTILLFISIIGNVSANTGISSGVGISCGGNNNLLIGCIGSADLSMFYGHIAITPLSGGGGGAPIQNITKIIPISKPTFKIDYFLIMLIAFAVCMFFFIIIKKKKDKKNKIGEKKDEK